jgi:hypothetical protein
VAPLLAAKNALAKLMAPLGGVLTRASRDTPLCLAKMTVALLRPNVERRIFGVAKGTSDAAVAFHLKTFLLNINLPPMFASRSARPTDVHRDLSDAIRYSFGTDEDRTAVETARLSSANGYATAPPPLACSSQRCVHRTPGYSPHSHTPRLASSARTLGGKQPRNSQPPLCAMRTPASSSLPP